MVNEEKIISRSRPTLRLPLQAVPVNRGTSTAALADGGVEADLFGINWDDVWGAAKKYGPGIASTVLGAL